MFSENQKISGRQAFRLLTYDLLGLSTLLVPTGLAQVAGRDGIFCIAIGIFAGLLYLKMMGKVVKDMQVSFPEYLEQKLGRFAGKLIQVGYLIYFVLLAGYTAYLFASVVLKNLLREETFTLVLVLILLLAAYGLWSGIEGRARVYELLFWFIMIPLFFMLFSALNEVETDYWAPVFYTAPSGIFMGSYYVFLCLALIFLILFLGSYVPKKETLMRAGRTALIFTGIIHGVLYLILLGIFGSGALASMDYPAITMMSTVKISGGFLKRADAFMFGIWFFTLYALLNSVVFYGGTMLYRLLEGRTFRFACGKLFSGKKKDIQQLGARAAAVAVLAAVFVTAGLLYRSEAVCKDYERFLWYIGTPFVVIVPLILAVRLYFSKKGKRADAGKIAALAIVLLAQGFLLGCNTAELEDRNFPIEVAVQDTKDFGAAWLNAESGGNRLVDYSHLKVVIISREFLEDTAAMQEFLSLMEERNDVPRNTYIVAAESPEDIIALGDKNGDSVGTYIEELLENVSEVKKKAYPTLGMLYQEKENRMETLFLPFVAEKDKKPVIDHYFVWKRGMAAGEADSEMGLLSFFTTNEMDSYTLIPADGTYVRLFSPDNEIVFQGTTKREVTVNIRCSGEVLYETGQQELSQEEIGQQIEAYMNGTASEALKRQQIDIADSYRKLGGYQRDWLKDYEEGNASYEEDLDIVYNVQITWVSR